MKIWVVEFRWSKKGAWELEAAYATRKEAKEHGWAPVPPAQHRIKAYVRKEDK